MSPTPFSIWLAPPSPSNSSCKMTLLRRISIAHLWSFSNSGFSEPRISSPSRPLTRRTDLPSNIFSAPFRQRVYSRNESKSCVILRYKTGANSKILSRSGSFRLCPGSAQRLLCRVSVNCPDSITALRKSPRNTLKSSKEWPLFWRAKQWRLIDACPTNLVGKLSTFRTHRSGTSCISRLNSLSADSD